MLSQHNFKLRLTNLYIFYIKQILDKTKKDVLTRIEHFICENFLKISMSKYFIILN